MRASPDTFRSLVEQHQRMVYSIAVRLLNDPGEAEEVAQDVFLELYDGLDRLESADHVKFWLRRVTVHRTTDALRRRTRYGTQSRLRGGPRGSRSRADGAFST
jgi:RNA polymerase sigma factor (sigma-70 family)